MTIRFIRYQLQTPISIKMKRIFFLLFIALYLFACKSDKEYPYQYWLQLTKEKYEEIIALTESVSCKNIQEFETISSGSMFSDYFLVHPSIKVAFHKLYLELEQLRTEMYKAAGREGIYFDSFYKPNPPLRKTCEDNIAKLIFVQDLSIEEINEELPIRYDEIKNFYNDTPCIDPTDWTVFPLYLAECCFEPIAVHKTIGVSEVIEKIEIYNRLINRKHQLDNRSCIQINCETLTKAVSCISGKPVIETVVH